MSQEMSNNRRLLHQLPPPDALLSPLAAQLPQPQPLLPQVPLTSILKLTASHSTSLPSPLLPKKRPSLPSNPDLSAPTSPPSSSSIQPAAPSRPTSGRALMDRMISELPKQPNPKAVSNSSLRPSAQLPFLALPDQPLLELLLSQLMLPNAQLLAHQPLPLAPLLP